jgi:hypothetical protein
MLYRSKTERVLCPVICMATRSGTPALKRNDFRRTAVRNYALGVTRGTVRGLGLTNLFTFQMPTNQGTVENGRFFLVAANGDRINGMYEGWTEVDETFTYFTAHAEWVITSGTGRFAHASGTIHATGHLTAASGLEWPFVWDLEGTINY